jgi:hypothetical protein
MAAGTSIVGLPRIVAPAASFALSNPILALGQEGVEEDSRNLKVGDGVTAWSLLPYFTEAPGQGPSITRNTTSYTTTTALLAGANESAAVPLSKSYRLLSITTNAVCRVRLYDRGAKQSLDLYRAIGTYPTGDHGLTYEFVGAPGLTSMDCSPPVIGSSMETVPSTHRCHPIRLDPPAF